MKALAETHGIKFDVVHMLQLDYLRAMMHRPSLQVTVAQLTRDENHPAVASRILEVMQA